MLEVGQDLRNQRFKSRVREPETDRISVLALPLFEVLVAGSSRMKSLEFVVWGFD